MAQGFLSSLLYFLKKLFFIYLAMPGLSCGTWNLQSLFQHARSCSLTRDRTWAPALGAWGLSQWTTSPLS